MSTPPISQTVAAAALDAVPFEIALLDADGVVTRTNLAWQRSHMPGTVGDTYAQVCGDELAADVLAALDHRPQLIPLLHTLATPQGKHWVQTTVQPLQVGEIFTVLVSHKNITDLADSERRFRELADNVAEIFWVFDWKRRKLTYISPSFERVFGRRIQDALNDPNVWIDAVHPDDRPRVNALFRATDQQPYEDRYRVLRPDGTVRWVRDRGQPVRDDQGHITRIVGIAEDITEQIHAHEQSLAAELDRAVLEKSEEERQQIGHELHDGLGQQITGLGMLIESARRHLQRGHPVGLDTLEELGRSTTAANTEVRRLIAGLTPDPIAAVELPANRRQVARNVETIFTIAAAADCDESPPALTNEQADHLLRIAQEAAHNAGKYSRASHITLTLRVEPSNLALSIADNGQGFNAVQNPKTGSGRGLPIMRHRADMIQGTFSISSTPSHGTRITVVMPLAGSPGPP